MIEFLVTLVPRRMPTNEAARLGAMAIMVIVVLLSGPMVESKTSEVKMEKWFTNKNCQKLELVKYKSVSEPKIVKSVTIQDLNLIETFMDRIEKVPANGDLMISFGPKAEYSQLNFFCDGEKQTVEIYNKVFKTPSTGFNSSQDENEKTLYREFDALLEPDFKKIIPKVKDLELSFGAFILTYKGSKVVTGQPTTASISEDHFLIRDKKGNQRTLVIISGQVPPAPKDFEIDRGLFSSFFPSKFTLLTYETSDGIRLYPDHFQVLKSK